MHNEYPIPESLAIALATSTGLTSATYQKTRTVNETTGDVTFSGPYFVSVGRINTLRDLNYDVTPWDTWLATNNPDPLPVLGNLGKLKVLTAPPPLDIIHDDEGFIYQDFATGAIVQLDRNRNRWIGVHNIFEGGGVNGTTSANLKRFNGMNITTSTGIHIPYDCMLVEWWGSVSTAVNTFVSVRRGSTDIDTANFSNTNRFTRLNRADLFAGDGRLTFNVGTSISNPQIHIDLRRDFGAAG